MDVTNLWELSLKEKYVEINHLHLSPPASQTVAPGQSRRRGDGCGSPVQR